jgi:hypothetical protein
MTLRKGLPAKLVATDADDTRYDLGSLVVAQHSASPRTGLTSKTGSTIVAGTATMAVTVSAFTAVAVRDAGAVLLANDGTVSLTLDAAPASNSRIDVIYAKQNDSSATVTTPDADNVPTIGFVKGTAAASPTKPALPVGAVELATVQIAAGNTNTNSSVITQSAPYTSAPGGEVPFRTLADLQLWTSSGNGQLAYVFGDPTAANNGPYRNIPATGWTWYGTYIADLVVTSPWVAGTGVNKPRARMQGGHVELHGLVTYAGSASYNDVAAVPSAFLPPTMSSVRPIGRADQVTGTSLLEYRAALNTNGHIGQMAGSTGSLPASGTVSLEGLGWWMD